MIKVSLQTLANVLGGELNGNDLTIQDIVTDTRKLTPGCLFIALKGDKFDGHHFATDAVTVGAGALLVSEQLSTLAVPQIVVEDTRIALGQIGAWVRQQVPARVIALTGSSGKTSVKEMCAEILRQRGHVLYTAGNFNNDIGVPLTLLRLTPEHDYAVIELGANHLGEIAYTGALAQPESVLVNNLAAAHIEGFGSLAGVAQAKGEIFDALPTNGTAVINAESNDWRNWQNKFTHQRIWHFSLDGDLNTEFFARHIDVTVQGTQFTLHTPSGEIEILLPLLGRHNIANALAAAALTMSVGATLNEIRQGLKTLKPVEGRLFPIFLNKQQLILDDTYNANVGSMIAAAQVLAEMPGYRVMVVGDMAELGADAQAYHRRVGFAVGETGIDNVLSVGQLSHLISDESGHGEHFADKAALIERLKSLLCEHEVITILVKGSRSARMEWVVRGITEQENQSC